MEILMTFVVWAVLSVAVGAWAKTKGLSPTVYSLLALLLSPLIGFLLVAIARPDAAKAGELAGKKKCPRCAEWVQGEALVCRHCGHAFGGE